MRCSRVVPSVRVFYEVYLAQLVLMSWSEAWQRCKPKACNARLRATSAQSFRFLFKIHEQVDKGDLSGLMVRMLVDYLLVVLLVSAHVPFMWKLTLHYMMVNPL